VARSSQPQFTAQVILRAAGAERARRPVTVENLPEALPDPEAVRAVQDFFVRAGLQPGPAFATSFPLQGPLDRFAVAFDLDPAELEAVARAPGAGAELDLSNLPEEVLAAIDAVVVTPTPDFGPTAP
jgi:hypothetical protein